MQVHRVNTGEIFKKERRRNEGDRGPSDGLIISIRSESEGGYQECFKSVWHPTPSGRDRGGMANETQETASRLGSALYDP